MCVRQLKHIYIYIYIQKLVPPNVQDMVTALCGTVYTLLDAQTVSPLSCVSCVPASCVHIWFVSCPRQM